MRNQSTAKSSRSATKSAQVTDDFSSITVDSLQNMVEDFVQSGKTNFPTLGSNQSVVLERMEVDDDTQEGHSDQKLRKPSVIKESVLNISYLTNVSNQEVSVVSKTKDSPQHQKEWRRNHKAEIINGGTGVPTKGESQSNYSKSYIDSFKREQETTPGFSSSGTVLGESLQKKSTGSYTDNRHISTFADFRVGNILDLLPATSNPPSMSNMKSHRRLREHREDENDELNNKHHGNLEWTNAEKRFLKSKVGPSHNDGSSKVSGHGCFNNSDISPTNLREVTNNVASSSTENVGADVEESMASQSNMQSSSAGGLLSVSKFVSGPHAARRKVSVHDS